MAKVQFGAIVTDMRNKLGSDVFSRNRHGAYTRSYKVNVPSVSDAQATQKALFAGIAASWNALAQSNRDAWNGAVSSFLHTDIFGSVVQPSGFNLFMRVNSNLTFIGESAVIHPPLPASANSIINPVLTVNIATSEALISHGGFDGDSVCTWTVMATGCISPGISYVKNLVRKVKFLGNGFASPANFWTEFVARYGTPVEGKRVSVKLLSTNIDSGIQSIPVYLTTIVINEAPPVEDTCTTSDFSVTGASGEADGFFHSILEINCDFFVVYRRVGLGAWEPVTAFSATGSGSDYPWSDFAYPGVYDYKVEINFLDSTTEVIGEADGIVVT